MKITIDDMSVGTVEEQKVMRKLHDYLTEIGAEIVYGSGLLEDLTFEKGHGFDDAIRELHFAKNLTMKEFKRIIKESTQDIKAARRKKRSNPPHPPKVETIFCYCRECMEYYSC
tara:strand:+ start:2006 stop:2347 length:342 start_codon:yes stop_codon:yes gene_type:complete